MTEKKMIYRCSICGNLVEVLDTGAGELVCCGQAMDKLVAKTAQEEGSEKHVPQVEKVDGGYKVSVGSIAHPMEDEHYIEWIELTSGDSSQKVFLSPGDKAEALFLSNSDNVSARAYCNIHFLWKN